LFDFEPDYPVFTFLQRIQLGGHFQDVIVDGVQGKANNFVSGHFWDCRDLSVGWAQQ
jgi:hypothetical protein